MSGIFNSLANLKTLTIPIGFDCKSRDSSEGSDDYAPRDGKEGGAVSLGGSSGGGSGDGLLLGDESLPSLGFGSGDGLALESGFGKLV